MGRDSLLVAGVAGLLLLAVIAQATLVSSTMVISDPVDGGAHSRSYPTAPFVYYGPKQFPRIEGARLVFLRSDLCISEHLNVESLKGAIVILEQTYVMKKNRILVLVHGSRGNYTGV